MIAAYQALLDWLRYQCVVMGLAEGGYPDQGMLSTDWGFKDYMKYLREREYFVEPGFYAALDKYNSWQIISRKYFYEPSDRTVTEIVDFTQALLDGMQ